MAPATPVLQIIIGSTRPGRKGPAVARWFDGVARAHGDFEVELIDLAEVALPFLEPIHVGSPGVILISRLLDLRTARTMAAAFRIRLASSPSWPS